jgi:hypothetical protein
VNKSRKLLHKIIFPFRLVHFYSTFPALSPASVHCDFQSTCMEALARRSKINHLMPSIYLLWVYCEASPANIARILKYFQRTASASSTLLFSIILLQYQYNGLEIDSTGAWFHSHSWGVFFSWLKETRAGSIQSP